MHSTLNTQKFGGTTDQFKYFNLLESFCLKLKLILQFCDKCETNESANIYSEEMLLSILNLIIGDNYEDPVLSNLSAQTALELLINHDFIVRVTLKSQELLKFDDGVNSTLEKFLIDLPEIEIPDSSLDLNHECFSCERRYEQYQKVAFGYLINNNDIPIFSHMYDALNEKNKQVQLLISPNKPQSLSFQKSWINNKENMGSAKNIMTRLATILGGDSRKKESEIFHQTFLNIQYLENLLKSLIAISSKIKDKDEYFKLIQYCINIAFPEETDFLFPSALVDLFSKIGQILCLEYDDLTALEHFRIIFVLMDLETYKLMHSIIFSIKFIFLKEMNNHTDSNFGYINALNRLMIDKLYFKSKNIPISLNQKIDPHSTVNYQAANPMLLQKPVKLPSKSLNSHQQLNWYETMVSFISKNLHVILTISETLKKAVLEFDKREYAILNSMGSPSQLKLKECETTDTELAKLFSHILNDPSISEKDKKKYVKKMKCSHPAIYKKFHSSGS